MIFGFRSVQRIWDYEIPYQVWMKYVQKTWEPFTTFYKSLWARNLKLTTYVVDMATPVSRICARCQKTMPHVKCYCDLVLRKVSQGNQNVGSLQIFPIMPFPTLRKLQITPGALFTCFCIFFTKYGPSSSKCVHIYWINDNYNQQMTRNRLMFPFFSAQRCAANESFDFLLTVDKQYILHGCA